MRGYPKLKGFLKEKGIKQEDAARVIGIHLNAFNNKLNGRSDFTMGEFKKLCEFLQVKADVFLN